MVTRREVDLLLAGNVRHIFRMPVEGGAPKQVTKEPAYDFRWSPDGTRLFFTGTNAAATISGN